MTSLPTVLVLLMVSVNISVSWSWQPKYIGCFGDDHDYPKDGKAMAEIQRTGVLKPGRALSGYFKHSKDMTVGKCWHMCYTKGLRYAGLQLSTYCFCGNFGFDRYGLRGNDECNWKCGGNQQETCGGFFTNSVYELPIMRDPERIRPGVTPADVWPPGAVPTPADNFPPSTTESIKPKPYVGCFRDNVSNRNRYSFQREQRTATPEPGRALTGYFSHTNDMSIKKCLYVCAKKGFKYTGLQYSSQCFCGNDGYDRYGKSNKPCAMKCSGDQDEICGDTWAISIYDTFNSLGR